MSGPSDTACTTDKDYSSNAQPALKEPPTNLPKNTPSLKTRPCRKDGSMVLLSAAVIIAKASPIVNYGESCTVCWARWRGRKKGVQGRGKFWTCCVARGLAVLEQMGKSRRGPKSWVRGTWVVICNLFWALEPFIFSLRMQIIV
jgi:hypothetical protein